MNYQRNNLLYKTESIYYDRIDHSEEIDVTKISETNECDIFYC